MIPQMLQEKRKLFEPGQIVAGYSIVGVFGQGGYGDVYSVKLPDSDQLFAMKVESQTAARRGLECELYCLSKLQSSSFFPRLIAFGRTHSDI
jgi:predicted Ser/Thr protein kinase